MNPIFVPLPVLVSNIVVSGLASNREWSDVHRRDLVYILAGRFTGTIPALIILAFISQKIFDITFSAIILIAVLFSIIGTTIPINRLSLFLAGTVSGLMGTVSSVGGPPTALVYKQVEGPRFRATMSMQLLVGGLFSVAGLLLITESVMVQIVASVVLLPGAILGYLLSNRGFKRINREAINVFVLAVSVLSAVLVIFNALN